LVGIFDSKGSLMMETPSPLIPPISRLSIFGVGLIGGSLALALKAQGMVGEVVGVGRSPSNMQWALEHGLIDRICDDPASAVNEAEIVVLAMPVGQMPAVMRDIAPHLHPGTLITDVGSTKQDVAALMRDYLAPHLTCCVPAHPIAGAELSGARAARADLYQSRNVVLTPLAETQSAAIARISAMWQVCGARVSQMSLIAHDTVFAAVSHLPHVLAYGLVDMLAARDNAEQLFGFAASGFRDFTRIAASSPEMWRDIALANRSALLQEMDAYLTKLSILREALARNDG
jgi:prephenate dehydrogenase